MIISEAYDFQNDLVKYSQAKSSIYKYLDCQNFSGNKKDLKDMNQYSLNINTSNLFNNMDEEFGDDFLKTKEKILEQVTIKKEDLPIQEENQVMEQDEIANPSLLAKNEEELNIYYQSIKNATKSILKNKKSGFKFEKFIDEIREKDSNFSFPDVFYNILCMAQNREVDIKQDEYFSNSTIILKLIK